MKKFYLLFLCIVASLLTFAEDVTTFFNAQSNGKYYVLDSVRIENVTRGWTRTIDCTVDTSVTYDVNIPIPTGIEDIMMSSADNRLISNYRNFVCYHNFTVNVTQSGKVSVKVLDMLGRSIVNYEELRSAGTYDFQISLSITLPVILSVSTANESAAMVIMNNSTAGNNTIVCEDSSPILRAPRSQEDNYYIYNGDQLIYTGYSHRQGEVIVDQVTVYQGLASETVTFEFQPADFSNEGVYVGVMGFNNKIYSYPIGLFGTDNLSLYSNFVNARTIANGTILAHAVYSALDSLELSPIPNKLADVTLVVFTDGLDVGSWRMNKNFTSSALYLQAVSNRIGRMYIDGIPLTSYSIGIKGSDVSDEVRFENDLRSLASDSTCVYNVKDMNEVKKKFRDIASKIRNSHTSYSLSLSIPAQEPGSRIRLTFDNVNDAALSEYYIEGTYDFDYDNFWGILTNVVYCGVTSTNGTSLVSVPDGIFDIFTINNLMTNLGERVNTSNMQQWYYIPSTDKWQVNSEFTPESGIAVTEERNSAIVMLVLDCSSSLSSNFSSIQSYTNEFLNVLAGKTSFSKPSVTTKAAILCKLSSICGGTITNDGGLTIIEKGICISKYSNMDSVRFIPSDSESTDFDVEIDELQEGQTYYYHAYARNNVGISFGTKKHFTAIDYRTANVSTTYATCNDYTTANVSGRVLSDGNQEVTERGVCYSTSYNPTIEDNIVISGSGVGSFACSLSNLQAGTIYYVRAYAINSMGVAYGEEMSFTTIAYSLPTLSTSSSWSTNYTSASGSFTVHTSGGAPISECGVCYATHSNPTIEDNKKVSGSGTGSYSVTITGLEEGTTYYVRAYTTTIAGTGYGEEQSFKTKGTSPTVSLSQIGTPTSISVTCTGYISSNGGVTLTEKGFCYSLEPEPTVENDHIVVAGTGTGSYSGTLQELSVNTTYYVRAYAVNKLGISYSDQGSFTTANGLAYVYTNSATATATTISVSGSATTIDGFAITERGYCYSATETEPTIANDKLVEGEGDGSFSVTIPDVAPSTKYYLRAYVTNENGTAYSSVINVTTKSGLASVTIGSSISNITATTASGTVKVTSVAGATVQQCGLCWSVNPDPTIEDSTVVAKGTSLSTSYSCTLQKLRPGTLYYVRAFATTEVTTSYSTTVIFTTADGLPSVVTNVATATATVISAEGQVTADGGFAVTERGICYSTINTIPSIDEDSVVIRGSGNGAFSANITGLAPSTKYYLRAYATNENGTSYGSVATVTTQSGAAALTLGSISKITATSASSTVKYTSVTGATVQQCGLCWSTNEYPTIEDSISIAAGTTLSTAYTCPISNLKPSTTYYVRAWATTEATTSYSTAKSFTTANGRPTVLTNGSSEYTATSITAGGEVTADGGFAVTECGLCYSSTESTPTVENDKVISSVTTGTFSVTMEGLAPSTTYYFRAYATNENGTSYGDIWSIQTRSGTATLTIGSISSITAVSAKSTATVTTTYGATVQRCGLCWSTSSNPTIEDSVSYASGTMLNTTYTCDISGLRPSTKYYVRAFATTEVTTSYSSTTKTFTTANGLPAVSTSTSATSMATSITAGGNVTADGGFNVTERGICYSSTTSVPTIENEKAVMGTGVGVFNETIKGLSASTTYYLRAYATNENGTVYGDIINATTQSGGATLSLATITNIKALSASSKVTVSSTYGAAVQSCGICWSTSQSPTIDDNISVAEGTDLNTAYVCDLTNLKPSTTYYVRAYVTTEVKTVYSSQRSFTTPAGLPTVITEESTRSATYIAANGNLTSDGGYEVTKLGFCYSTTNANPTIEDSKLEGTGTIGEFTRTITNLIPATTYYVRAFAVNIVGVAYGEPIEVTTLSGVANVSLGQMSNVKALSANATFTITDDNGATLQQCGICWSTNPNPTIANYIDVASGNQVGEDYLCTLSDLQPSTTYYVRAYAITSIATSYSNAISFTTPSGLPTISKSTNTAATATTYTITGNVTDNGGYAVTERGVCYSTTNNPPTISDIKIVNGSGNGSFSITISELMPSTTYYLRTYAKNAIGTGYSDVVTITTKSGIAISSLGTFSNVRAFSASNAVTVSNANGATLQSCGICWSTTPNPTIVDNKVVASGNVTNTAYNCEMVGLQENTTYYVRAFAITDIATSYSEQKTVTTAAVSLPTVSLSSRTIESASSVTCTGNVSFDGNVDITERGFCWGTTSNPTIANNYKASTSGTGTYTEFITGLNTNTTYYIRAYAKNQKGISYSSQSSVYISTITYSATSKLTETTNEKTAGLHTNAFNVSVNAHTFSGGMGTIVFDGKVTTIGNFAFYQCSALTGINIPTTVTAIGDYSFAGCTSWTSFSLPSNVTSVGLAAFGNCGFTSITIPNTITNYGGGYTFLNCSTLVSVTLPSNMTSIPEAFLGGCPNLTTVNMPDNVVTIGALVFYQDSKLSSITIPSTVTTIGEKAFESCTGLKSVTIHSNAIVSTVYTNDSNSGLKSIFGNQVTSYTIGSGVTNIGNFALYQCTNLTSLDIASTVSAIGPYAFAECTSLTSIKCRAMTPPSCTTGSPRTFVFNNVTKTIPVYVPSSATSKYKSAVGWKDFTNYKSL